MWAEDGAERWNDSGYWDVGVDTTGPNATLARANVSTGIEAPALVRINASVADNLVGVDAVLIEVTRPDSSLVNLTTARAGAEYYNDSFNLTLPGNYSFRFLANDTLNNRNDSVLALTSNGTVNLTVVDTTKPLVGTLHINATGSLGVYSFVCLNVTGVADNISVDTVLATVTQSNGTVLNLTMADASPCAGGTGDGVYGVEADVGSAAGSFWYNGSTVNDTSGNSEANMTAQGRDVFSDGFLEVRLVKPLPEDLTSVVRNSVFLVNATVFCRQGTCANVAGTARYNATTATPDAPLSTQGGTPFFINETPAAATKDCLDNPLGIDEYCNVSWQVNASGASGTVWEIGVFFNSTGATAANHTDNATVSIVPCAVDITTAFPAVSFGELNPSQPESNASENANGGYNITIQPGSCETDLYVKGTDLAFGNERIRISNLTVSNGSFGYNYSFPLNGSFQRLYLNATPGANVTTYYWMNVPAVFAGLYAGTISFNGVQTGGVAP